MLRNKRKKAVKGITSSSRCSNKTVLNPSRHCFISTGEYVLGSIVHFARRAERFSSPKMTLVTTSLKKYFCTIVYSFVRIDMNCRVGKLGHPFGKEGKYVTFLNCMMHRQIFHIGVHTVVLLGPKPELTGFHLLCTCEIVRKRHATLVESAVGKL